jgi:hypothetical protein
MEMGWRGMSSGMLIYRTEFVYGTNGHFSGDDLIETEVWVRLGITVHVIGTLPFHNFSEDVLE